VTRTFDLAAYRPAQRIDFDGALNEAQRGVVTAAGGPMLVIAGAGTGKTRCLTYRLAWLLDHGVEPDRLLLMTFTNRAAREMLQRVRTLIPYDADRVWAGTFHHVANRLLREHGSTVGLGPDFTILDREDAAECLASCVAEAQVKIERRRFPPRSALLAMNSFVVNTCTPLQEVLDRRYPMFAALQEKIAEVLGLYAAAKHRGQLVDYDDLLQRWLQLLDSPPAGMPLGQFHHILVDEYQDTNAIQGRIVDRLAAGRRNVCVVGDDAQSIYSFRGANLENMLRFGQRYPDAVEHRLETNYRSTPQILALANASVARNRRRLPKRLSAVRPEGLRPAVVPCADRLVQSRFIARYILHLLDEGRVLEDIAVLYRSHWHALEIQLELQRHDIPFRVRGGTRFFEQAHIKDVLGFLRLRHNGRDELAWRRVLRLVPRIGGVLTHRIWARIGGEADPVRAACDAVLSASLPSSARRPFGRFTALLERVANEQAPAGVLQIVLERFYGDHLVGHHANAALRRQDIEALIEFAAQYRTVEAFLSDAALAGDFDGETCEDGPTEQLFVTLSTVHQAKGLEWPVVFIPWVADGRFPTDLAMGSRDDLEEERRVFHVAVTRARDELYLVVPQIWSNHRRRRILMKPSRFITELDEQNLFETMRIEGDLSHVTAGAESDRATKR
jgi:DNA helicase-2/ATP-dependent DNA helicase PcrA